MITAINENTSLLQNDFFLGSTYFYLPQNYNLRSQPHTAAFRNRNILKPSQNGHVPLLWKRKWPVLGLFFLYRNFRNVEIVEIFAYKYSVPKGK